MYFFFFFKQKTAYELRISDWSSDVCSSDLAYQQRRIVDPRPRGRRIDDAKVEMRIERGKIGIDVSQRARIVGIVFAAHAVRIDREARKAGRRSTVRTGTRVTRARDLAVPGGINTGIDRHGAQGCEGVEGIGRP